MDGSTDTRLARLVRSSASLVEVRVKPDIKIDVAGLQEVMRVRKAMLAEGSGAILWLAPGELDWDVAALRTDLFGAYQESIQAMAVIVDNSVLTIVVNLYFSYFPSKFPIRVFTDENEARAWLIEMGERKRS